MAPPSVSPALSRELVLSLLPPLRQDPTVLKQVTDHISREVKADVQGSSRMTWEEVGQNIAGLARTARVRVQSDLADALDKSVSKLDGHRRAGQSAWEGDMPVKMSNLSQHVQFLLAMACQPTTKTHDLANEYLNRKPLPVVDEDRRLYDEIMRVPFDGDHWQEGYEPEVEGWTDSESERMSSGSGEPEEAIITPPRERERLASVVDMDMRVNGSEERDRRIQDAERELRNLGTGAYWITGGQGVESVEIKDGWRSVSTGPSVASLSSSLDPGASTGMKAITGIQFMRELLFALSGRPGVMINFKEDSSCFIISDHPTVLHYSPHAVKSILSTFQHRAGQASAIRRLVRDTLSPIGTSASASQLPTRTTQAFAEACRLYMSTVDVWVADLELAIVRGSDVSTIFTPLSLRLELDTKFGTMLDTLSSILPYAQDPVILLNALYATLQTVSKGHSPLFDIFITTASPLWETLGDWLIRGMPIPRSLVDVESRSEAERPLDREFWIDRDRDVSWTDEDFWEAAFILKNDRPYWITDDLLEATLEAGKARGLLRGLLGSELNQDETGGWTPLSAIFRTDTDTEDCGREKLGSTISAYLSPRCQMTTFHLRRVMDEDCGLQAHLEAVDGLFYHQGINSMQSWSEWLFSQVVGRKKWSDFQILTSTLREQIEKRGEGWLNPAAIRIDPGGSNFRRPVPAHISPAILSTLKPTYRVPFPLSQLFTSTSLDLRGDVFTFLIQLQFGRYLISRTRFAEFRAREGTSALLRQRHRLSFILDTIWTWITERVIQLETGLYKVKLDETTSFGAMIQLEMNHARRIRIFSFQHAKTSAINENVSRILEMTADLHDLFISLESETKTESTIFKPAHASASASMLEEKQSTTPKDHHVQGRSRRRVTRHHKRHRELSSDESDDESDPESTGLVNQNQTLKSEISFVEQSLDERVKRFGVDLDEKVKCIKEGLEDLSTIEGGEDEVEIWDMLSFALQDWK